MSTARFGSWGMARGLLSLVGACLMLCSPPAGATGLPALPPPVAGDEVSPTTTGEAPRERPSCAEIARKARAAQIRRALDAREPLSYQRHFGIGASVWRELGWSGVVRARYKWVGADAALGFAHYSLIVTNPCPNVLVGGDVRLTVSGLGFVAETAEVSHGFRVGGIYDGFFGFGGMLGYLVEATVTKHFVVSAGAGVQAFPWGHERANRGASALCGVETGGQVVPLTANLHWYVGMQVLFYPF